MADRSFSLAITYGNSSFVPEGNGGLRKAGAWPWSLWSLDFHGGHLVLWTSMFHDLAAFKVIHQTLSQRHNSPWGVICEVSRGSQGAQGSSIAPVSIHGEI